MQFRWLGSLASRTFARRSGLVVWGLLPLMVLATARPAVAEYRVALLIGNSQYPEAELASPPRDVAAMAEVLKKRGFRVTVVENLDGGAMQSALKDFAETIPTHATAVVYFSGYALYGQRGESNRDNYLFPLNGNGKNAWEITRAGVGVRSVLAHLSEFGGSSTHVVIVDGCYPYPYEDGPITAGLKSLDDLPESSVIAYGQPLETVGEPANDGVSPFTAKLVERLKDPKQSLDQALRATAGYYTTNEADLSHWAEPASQAVAPPDAFRPGRRVGDEWVSPQGVVFCWCPPGKFTMGSPEDDPLRHADEGPVEVQISQGFWFAKYQFTREQARLISGRYPYRSTPGHKNSPTNGLEMKDYFDKVLGTLNKDKQASGGLPADWEYALPTEAQWEYAARAGTTTRWYFGDDASQLPLHANFADRTLLESAAGQHPYAHPSWDDGAERITQVGQYLPNPWGLHDVYGNLWDWCHDHYTAELPGGRDPLHFDPDARGPRVYRVARGGAWLSPPDYCRSAFRHRFVPGIQSVPIHVVGYRLMIRKAE